MAYIYMPLLLSLVSFLMVYIFMSPYIHMALSAVSLLSNSSEVSGNAVSEADTPLFVTKGDESEDGQPESIAYSPDMYPKLGELYARISCERLGIAENVYFNDTAEILDLGVGQYAGSSIFGFGKPILLGGHHGSKFKPLEYVEIGDIFTVQTSYGLYSYEVYDTRVAHEDDKTAFDLSKNEEYVIMYTCYPFKPLASYSQRLYVYAKKISGPDLIH